MFTPGHYATMFLPTHEHLPFLDTSGPAYLQRNFSALGFSCENWQNESVNLTILPVTLHGPDGKSLPIDEFTPKTAHLWGHPYPVTAHSAVVPEPSSPSGYALQLVCAANATSCGAPKSGLCPPGCLLDSSKWCQAIQTTFVNRLPSRAHPLPTELDPLNTIDVRTFESFDLKWKMSANFEPPPAGSSGYPIGVQTMVYPQGCFCNKTLTFCGNAVRSTLKPVCDGTSIFRLQSQIIRRASKIAARGQLQSCAIGINKIASVPTLDFFFWIAKIVQKSQPLSVLRPLACALVMASRIMSASLAFNAGRASEPQCIEVS